MMRVLEQQHLRKIDDRIFPLGRSQLRKRFVKARKAAGLEDVTIHDLRRTHSTLALIGGVDLRTLSGRGGHSMEMLQKHYAALVGSAANEAAIKIEEAFKAP